MNLRLNILATIVALVWTSVASGALPQLVIEERNSSDTLLTTTYDDTPSSIADLTLQSTTSRVNIYVEYSDPPESPIAIGHIKIVGGGAATVNIIVGKGAFRDDDTPMGGTNPMRCSSWRGLQVPVSATVFRLYGRLTGDLIGSNTTGFTNVTFMNLDRLRFCLTDHPARGVGGIA